MRKPSLLTRRELADRWRQSTETIKRRERAAYADELASLFSDWSHEMGSHYHWNQNVR